MRLTGNMAVLYLETLIADQAVFLCETVQPRVSMLLFLLIFLLCIHFVYAGRTVATCLPFFFNATVASAHVNLDDHFCFVVSLSLLS